MECVGISENVHKAFVEKFSDYWAAPSVERMPEILTNDVILLQPLSHPMEGLAAAQDEFRRLFQWIPDLHGDIEDWGGHGDTLFISFTLTGTVGRNTTLHWPLVDRFDLVGDKACKRVSYFNPFPLLWTVLRTPSAWWSWWYSGVARPWRR